VHREFGEPGLFVKVGKALGIALLATGLFWSIEGALKPKGASHGAPARGARDARNAKAADAG